MFKCPHPICKKKYNSLMRLKSHFQKVHENFCPICKKEYKSLPKHAWCRYIKFKDEEHLVIWYLSRKSYSNKYGNNKELFRKAKELCEKYLDVK